MKHNLGDVELEIMNIVWQQKKASVNDVLNEIRKKRDVAYTTVMTMLSILAKKNYLGYEQEGRSYIYFAILKEDSVKKGLLKKTIDQVFAGSTQNLLQFMLKSEEFSNEDQEKIQIILNQIEKKNESK